MEQHEDNLHDEATHVEKVETPAGEIKLPHKDLYPNAPKKTFGRNFFAVFVFLLLLTFMRAVLLSSPKQLPLKNEADPVEEQLAPEKAHEATPQTKVEETLKTILENKVSKDETSEEKAAEDLPKANIIDFNTLTEANEAKRQEEVKAEKIPKPKKKMLKKSSPIEFTEEELNNDLAEKLNLERLSNGESNEAAQ
ncbi:MAG: hypothetical protein COX62_00540 [Deltaproteobacteria bacterium CG_4_10_14_0_2_um_filter_43_8]|nr:MAG: hypothetical protein COV43_00315 [Deltaproteobacteria bacterium CG11_big_fil_rev_8_21_14_0_20_42_23]PJA22196.1 MAG: hypothetical protein COX62_00540 [Deltaproteobacteria bacterium CG_4_10_14_0_2_um_filter_43_8]PJC64462.1 MAG: hypothetical protein CO021_04220 [Deltaproteobacteria bacterium CG_4_9_14_0_2_um_filter_42_21]